MSEVNYRRNVIKYSTTGKCWGMAPVKVPGAGCLVVGAWWLVPGAGCSVPGAWCLVLGAWCLVRGARILLRKATEDSGGRRRRGSERARRPSPQWGAVVTILV